jgi:hypothetical protein
VAPVSSAAREGAATLDDHDAYGGGGDDSFSGNYLRSQVAFDSLVKKNLGQSGQHTKPINVANLKLCTVGTKCGPLQ